MSDSGYTEWQFAETVDKMCDVSFPEAWLKVSATCNKKKLCNATALMSGIL
jgi:hypothetical protein